MPDRLATWLPARAHLYRRWQAAYDAASYLVPLDPNTNHRWIGQGVRSAFALYYKVSALLASPRYSCSPGGLWDFFARNRIDIGDDLLAWVHDPRLLDDAGMCRQIAALTESTDQWNAYGSLILERLQGFQPGSAGRAVTEENSFDRPAPDRQ